MIELVQSDITLLHADAIVNAANEQLAGGAGVDGAIHRAGGRAIMEQCRAIGSCPTGSAVITGAGDLHARYVIHAVAPIYRGMETDAQLLASAYRRALALADEHALRSIAFPSLGTGAYGYPIEQAARIALATVMDHLTRSDTAMRRAIFALFSARDFSVYDRTLRSLQRPRPAS